jgi:hypothetical protein
MERKKSLVHEGRKGEDIECTASRNEKECIGQTGRDEQKVELGLVVP